MDVKAINYPLIKKKSFMFFSSSLFVSKRDSKKRDSEIEREGENGKKRESIGLHFGAGKLLIAEDNR